MPATQYLNRRFDVLALRGATPQGEVQLNQSLFGAEIGGEVCTGVQKLAQRWTIEFLTIRGSMPFHLANRGSGFMSAVKRGILRNEADVQAQYNFAAVVVRQNLINEETADMHPEDRFAKATLLQIQLGPGTLSLVVRIDSQSGEAREVILPIALTPVELNL